MYWRKRLCNKDGIQDKTMISRNNKVLGNRTLAILAFHKIGEPAPGGWESWFYVPEETFEGYLKYLHESGWQVVDVFKFIQGLVEPNKLPERAALITFDDGYRSVRDVALPLLRRFGYPAVLFIPTDYIGRYNTFDNGIEPKEEICDWDDLRELRRAGVSIQSHGASHRRFSLITVDEQRDELIRSKAILEKNLGDPVEIIAFPYGDLGAHKEKTTTCVKETGYQAACLYAGDPFFLPTADRYCLPRIAMGPDTNLQVVLEMSGTDSNGLGDGIKYKANE